MKHYMQLEIVLYPNTDMTEIKKVLKSYPKAKLIENMHTIFFTGYAETGNEILRACRNIDPSIQAYCSIELV